MGHKPINTPLGWFPHRLRLGEKYKCRIDFLKQLDHKNIPKTRNYNALVAALTSINYDFTKTLRENGFNYE